MLLEGHEQGTNLRGNIYLPLGQSSLRKTPEKESNEPIDGSATEWAV